LERRQQKRGIKFIIPIDFIMQGSITEFVYSQMSFIELCTGNTARRAFKVIDVLLKITGLKSELLYKLKIIPHHPHPSNYPRKEIKDFFQKIYFLA